MLLRRKIEIEMEERDELVSLNDNIASAGLLEYFTKKLQEAFDFGFAEGKKENEK